MLHRNRCFEGVLVLITVLQNNMPLFVFREFCISSILEFFSFCLVSFLDLTASMAWAIFMLLRFSETCYFFLAEIDHRPCFILLKNICAFPHFGYHRQKSENEHQLKKIDTVVCKVTLNGNCIFKPYYNP